MDEADIEATPSIDRSLGSIKYYVRLSLDTMTQTCAARSESGGPRPLRGSEGAELIGRKGLSQHESDDVKAANILADRTAASLEWFIDHCKRILEQPAPREGQTSMTKLAVAKGVSPRFTQCKLGQKFRKNTIVLGWVSFDK